MGTISDKLMRVINTKEDIRKALISKGYDVPTSIPFKEYAKMILDLPCNADSFPDIEGIVARYSASGITNEQMAANPVWVDKTGNGRDFQLKNFSWKGMSGVGGYVGDFSKWVNNRDTTEIGITKSNSKVIIDVKVSQGSGKNIVFISKSNLGISNNVTIKITSTYPEGVMKFANSASNKYLKLPSNGIITLQDNPEYTSNEMHLHLASADLGQITIEQLPLYPGALVFDGVDDYGTCDNFPILTKEKGYTVVALRQWIEEKNSITALVSNSKNWNRDGAFVFEYNNLENNYPNLEISFGSNTNLGREKSSFTYQTSKLYNGKEIKFGEFLGSDKLIVAKANENLSPCSNVAIWELVFLDHDATEEELTKIKDYFVKTYPWLFPYQAWTVTGKTNEDEDRATIANITGNGNDLVLSNFGFAEGSGYGLYAYNFNSFSLRDNVVKPTDVKKDSFRMIGTGNSNNVLILLNESDSADWKIRITGMKEGDRCLIGNANKTGEYISVNKDGTYTFQKQYAATSPNGIWYNSSQEVDVLVEQIPEYEGYLVTDGVDDKVESSPFTFNKDWTIVGNWTMLSNIPSNCGIIKVSSMFLYNSLDGVTIYFTGGPIKIQSKSINAFCSDGRIYLNDWTEILKPDVQIASGGSKSSLNIASYSANFTKMAFKNLAIYDGKNLSKDDCIKAYNYLQTLKSK